MLRLTSLLFFSVLYFLLNAQPYPVGINLTGIVDWSTELVFTDAFKQSREWIAHDDLDGAAWSSSVSVPLSKNGYPLEIPYRDGVHPPQLVRALMNWGPDLAYPSGKYRLIVAGSGQVRLWGAASGRFTCPVDTLVSVRAGAGGVVLELERSLASDPIRDIQFIFPKYTQSYTNQLFTQEFLNFVADFNTIRFMDWTRTNGSAVVRWTDRTPVGYYTQTKDTGVAWEYVVDLCNTTKKHAWINIPHQADDTYIRQLAEFFKTRLDPSLKIYLEYSNEVWNGIFAQNEYAATAGQALAYTGQPWERAWKYTVKRSADVFYQFENVFGTNSGQLVKIIPCFAVNDWITNQMLTYLKDPLYNPRNVTADAIAIAPYFGHDVANQIGEQKEVDTISNTEIVRRIQQSLAPAFASMDAQKAVAARYGLTLLAYEGGAHVVATWPHIDNEALTQKLITANRSPEIQDIYCTYSNYWYNHTKGDLFCFFSSHVTPTKWGSWGLKEYMDDTQAPRYKALQSCVFSENTTRVSASDHPSATVVIAPNPTLDGSFIIHHRLVNPRLHLYNTFGQTLTHRVSRLSEHTMQVQVSHTGLLFGLLENGEETASFQVVSH